MEQKRDKITGRFLPKPKERIFTKEDIILAFKAGINESNKGFLTPTKKAEMYYAQIK